MPGENSGNMGGGAAGSEYGNRRNQPAPRTRGGGKTRTRVKAGDRVAPRRPTPTYKPKRPAPPRRRVSSGGGGGGGGGGYSSNASGNLGALADPGPPPAPSLNDFLAGDETYQGQLAAITKALANYRSQMGERQDEYTADFSSRLKDLNLTEERNTADQADDYAGRGLYISGLYGKARGDLEQDFNRREGDMNMAKNQFMSGLSRDYTNFQEEQNLSRTKSRSDAINRRALKYML